MAFEIPKGSDYFWFGFDLRELTPDPNEIDPYLGDIEDWPKHITSSPPILDMPELPHTALFNGVRKLCADTDKITVVPTHDAYFGDDGEIPVTVFNSGKLRILHLAMLGELVMNGYVPGVHYDPQYAGSSGYNPHTSHMEGDRVPRDPIELPYLSLMRKVKGRKFVQERFPLGN